MVSASVRVVVADDHPIYRSGVAQAVREHEGLELAGEAEGGRRALALIDEQRPDVVLLDAKMDFDGLAVLDVLAGAPRRTQAVMLSAYLDGALIHAALARGARGYLSKASDRDDICRAVRAAARGEVVMSADVQTALGQHIEGEAAAAHPGLSERELEVLAHVAHGLSAPAIAREMHLSVATIKTHLGHIYAKLGVPDRAGAVAEALRRGILR
jgi:two-component system nitrate/nitrite response regulator NarL